MLDDTIFTTGVPTTILTELPPLETSNFHLMCARCCRPLGEHLSYNCIGGGTFIQAQQATVVPEHVHNFANERHICACGISESYWHDLGGNEMRTAPLPAPTTATAPVSLAHEKEMSSIASVNLKPPHNLNDLTKVKVSIKLVDRNYIVTCTHAPGIPSQIANYMPTKEQAKRVRDQVAYYGDATANLRTIISVTTSYISLEQWSAAIAAEIIARLGAPIEGECELSTIAAGAYLALSNGVYRLTPVEVTNKASAIAALRRRVLETSRVDAERIISEGKRSAALLEAKALTSIKDAEALKSKLELQLRQTPPRWVLDNAIPMCFAASKWRVSFVFNFRVNYFDYQYSNAAGDTIVKRWKALPMDDQKVRVWVPLTGEKCELTSIRACYLDPEYGFYLPHVTTESGCLDATDTPRHIDSLTSVTLLKLIFKRVMSAVALESLFSHYEQWHPVLKAAAPDRIKAVIAEHRLNALSGIESDETRTSKPGQDVSETFVATAAQPQPRT